MIRRAIEASAGAPTMNGLSITPATPTRNMNRDKYLNVLFEFVSWCIPKTGGTCLMHTSGSSRKEGPYLCSRRR